jgi:P4 family phage/plasmid primase-like protien
MTAMAINDFEDDDGEQLAGGAEVIELPVANAETLPQPQQLAETVAAEMVAQEMKGTYIYVTGRDWFRWTSKRWKSEPDEVVRGYIAKWVRAQWDEAIQAWREDHSEASEKRAKEWKGLNAKPKIENIMVLTRSLLLVDIEELDADPDLWNCWNGTVDLRTGELRPHDPCYLITHLSSAPYVPGARHPLWDKALEAVDASVLEWFKVKLGQSITGHTSENDQILFWYGDGRNGKSTILNGLFAVMGEYAVMISERVVGGSANDHPTELMDLKGARAAFIEEMPEKTLNMPRIKSLSGTSYITARRMYRNPVTFRATHTMNVTTNYRLRVTDTDDGSWRRLVRIPFTLKFMSEDEFDAENPRHRLGDPALRKALEECEDPELMSAILAFLVDGSVAWHQNGMRSLPMPAIVKESTEEWRQESDPILRFWAECLRPDEDSIITCAEMYETFSRWMKRNGQVPMGSPSFTAGFAAHTETEQQHVVGPHKMKLRGKRVSRPSDYYGELPEGTKVWRGVEFHDTNYLYGID